MPYVEQNILVFSCLNILPGQSNSDVTKSSLSSKNTVGAPAKRARPGPSLPLSVLLLSGICLQLPQIISCWKLEGEGILGDSVTVYV